MGNLFSHCVSSPAAPRRPNVVAPSSGAATNPQQQAPLSAADWFLTQDELTSSRGGEARNDLSLFSTNVHVTTFSSSDVHFRQLLQDMDASDVASIWISGWSLTHTVALDPTRDDFEKTTLRAVVERAVRDRGVHVRALVWANLFERTQCLATRDWMNGIRGTGSALMLFDNRLPHHVSSHHQKCVVIHRKSGEFVAFMGGLDLTLDRWDTRTHDQSGTRVSTGWKGEFDGWVDASVRLEGEAARDVAATFAARWNSSVKPANCWSEELLAFENPKTFTPVPSPRPPQSTSNVTPTTSTVAVQIVRTFSPVRAAKMYPTIAPKGEVSLLEARLKAIGLAQNWIYVEDQYFFFMPQLMTALRSALTSHSSLRVVVIVQNPTRSTQSKVAGYEKLLFDMARPLLDAFASRVHIYTTKTARNLYIHTKALIVDDAFLSISSANWNRRSMTSDSELGANFVDAETVDTPDGVHVGKLVREFQLSKLEEFTGLSKDSLRELTIVQRCDALAQAADERWTILERLEIEKKWEFVVFHDEFTLHVVDPDDVNHTEHGAESSDGD